MRHEGELSTSPSGEVVSLARFLGESLVGEPLQRIDPCSCAFMV
jgi:hypothetical protein